MIQFFQWLVTRRRPIGGKSVLAFVVSPIGRLQRSWTYQPTLLPIIFLLPNTSPSLDVEPTGIARRPKNFKRTITSAFDLNFTRAYAIKLFILERMLRPVALWTVITGRLGTYVILGDKNSKISILVRELGEKKKGSCRLGYVFTVCIRQPFNWTSVRLLVSYVHRNYGLQWTERYWRVSVPFNGKIRP